VLKALLAPGGSVGALGREIRGFIDHSPTISVHRGPAGSGIATVSKFAPIGSVT
jgi:hypothetical protein